MLAYLWYIVGDQRHLVGDFMGKYEHIILILLAALLVWRIVKKVYKNIQKNNK